MHIEQELMSGIVVVVGVASPLAEAMEAPAEVVKVKILLVNMVLLVLVLRILVVAEVVFEQAVLEL